MASRLTVIEIPRAILEEVYREARKAFPEECCGWLAGSKGSLKASTVRPCTNVIAAAPLQSTANRSPETGYVMASQDVIELNRSFDGDQPALVIFHSHPNGRAYFSETDRGVATSPWGDGPSYQVQQLVVGTDAHSVVEAALFAWSDEASCFIEIARYNGAPV